ncbi:MAG: amidase [Thermoleophilaceae bacterium]|nr:amidase [Thermoleophilaceae bacterium]
MFRPALELAELVRSGEVSAVELTQEALERIDASDPAINAFTTLDAERALQTASQVGPGDERPFAGVPIAIKDLFTPVEGIRMANGSDLFGELVPPFDCALVRRVREAGFVIVGVTASPEFGILPTTSPRRFGHTRNPWDLDRVPGGSSGGSGAAVAAGMVPVAHGSDGGGSIRIPAACCGLVGLKPARGRLSRAPISGWHYTSTDGALTRTVADSAAMLDVMAGYEPGDTVWLSDPERPFAESAARDPGPLRIALMTTSPLGNPVDSAYVTAAEDAAGALSDLGHEVFEGGPHIDPGQLLPHFTNHWAVGVSEVTRAGAMIRGAEATEDDVEPLSWALHQIGSALSAPDYRFSLAVLERTTREIVGDFAGYDVLLTPALAEPPLPLDEIDPCGPDPMSGFARSASFTPFTAIWNVTGQPAISLPLYQSEAGLPLGVQLVGHPAREDVLLSLGAQLEAALPWANRRPNL